MTAQREDGGQRCLSRPRGDGLLRARVAGVTLIAASGAQLVASGLAELRYYQASVLCAVIGTLAWLPALHGLEHFLKRRTEALSLVTLGAGTVGVIMLISSSARASAQPADAVPEWPWTWILAARILLPLSLGLAGFALARYRLLPAWAATALGVGGLIQSLNWAGVLALPPLADQCLVCVGATWLGGRILLDPERWRRGTP